MNSQHHGFDVFAQHMISRTNPSFVKQITALPHVRKPLPPHANRYARVSLSRRPPAITEAVDGCLRFPLLKRASEKKLSLGLGFPNPQGLFSRRSLRQRFIGSPRRVITTADLTANSEIADLDPFATSPRCVKGLMRKRLCVTGRLCGFLGPQVGRTGPVKPPYRQSTD